MEAGRNGSLYVVFLVVVLLAGQCTASFDDCYKGCFLSCAISPDNAVFTCAVRCLKDCIFNFASPGHHSCSMSCAYSSCSHISARDNPREEEVASHMQQGNTRLELEFSPTATACHVVY